MVLCQVLLVKKYNVTGEIQIAEAICSLFLLLSVKQFVYFPVKFYLFVSVLHNT
jgi:hypothetical protein